MTRTAARARGGTAWTAQYGVGARIHLVRETNESDGVCVVQRDEPTLTWRPSGRTDELAAHLVAYLWPNLMNQGRAAKPSQARAWQCLCFYLRISEGDASPQHVKPGENIQAHNSVDIPVFCLTKRNDGVQSQPASIPHRKSLFSFSSFSSRSIDGQVSRVWAFWYCTTVERSPS